MGPEVFVRRLQPQDEAAAEELLGAELGGRRQVRLDEAHDVLALPGFAACPVPATDELAGVTTYETRGQRAELAVLAVATGHQGRGVGGALVDAVVAAVAAEGARELWLVTTNDNLDALRLYQRRQFRLREIRVGAVDRARRVKPEIPLVGRHGIRIHDELVLVRPLNGD